MLLYVVRIQTDLVDPEKLQAVLSDKSLGEACELNQSLEMVAILEAQLKEMNPNLDSISEYKSCIEVIGSLSLYIHSFYRFLSAIKYSHQV